MMETSIIQSLSIKDRLSTRGFVLSQLLIEVVIILGLIATLLSVATGYISACHIEDIKLKCLAANISVIEIIKQKYHEGEDIENCVGYLTINGEYMTSVTSFEEIQYSESAVYRITVDTLYKYNYIGETGLINYINAH